MKSPMTVAKKSQVAINAHLMSGSATYRSAGISTYLTNLLTHIKSSATLDFEILVGSDACTDMLKVPYTIAKLPTNRPSMRILWEQFVLPVWLSSSHIDVLHSPAFIGPVISPCPQVVTIHDLSFLRYPQFFKKANRLYLSLMTGFTCRRAAAVIAVSKFTASEVVSLLRVQSDKLHTIYHGVDKKFQPLSPQEINHFKQKMGLPEKYILFLGTLEPRKNLVQLVRAYAKLKQKDIHLVIAGAQGWYYNEIFSTVEALSLSEYVHFPGYINSEDQVLWYNSAYMFAYLSTYEGFGLPVLEALACGIPTLTSTSSSLPEAGGDGALQVPGDNIEAIVEGMRKLISDHALRMRLRHRGLDHAKKFTWQATADNTTRIYQEVCST